MHGIAIGTDGNPVVIHGGHPINPVRCDDRICAGTNETVSEINGTFCGARDADLAINADGNPIVRDATNNALKVGGHAIVP